MIFRKAIVLFLVASSILSCTYNPFSNTLKGERLYGLTATTSNHRLGSIPLQNNMVTEAEFYFQSENEVTIKVTAIYMEMGSQFLREKDFPILTYPYTYKNGVLNIYEMGMKEIKLDKHTDFYSTSDGEVLYTKSISDLPVAEKENRLRKLTSQSDNVINNLLESEIVLKIN